MFWTTTIIVNHAMFGLFRPHEEHVGTTILTLAALCFVIFWGWMLKFSSGLV
jgi:hypothetical protein